METTTTTKPQAMDAATKEALTKSIEHWRRLSDGTRMDGEGISQSECALCKRFFSKATGCASCPVRIKTGAPFCTNSPYDRATEVRKFGLDSEEFKAAAKLELEFLESLLPK